MRHLDMVPIRDCVLVCNAGSSSLKCELFELDGLASIVRGAVRGIGSEQPTLTRDSGERPLDAILDHSGALEVLLGSLLDTARRDRDMEFRVVAVGHRIVHGGARFVAPVRVSLEVSAEIESLCDLAPLHNPPAVAVLEALQSRLPAAVQVAVFDTAFFSELPAHAKRYAVPEEWFRVGAERFGFHGIAHQYMYRQLTESAAPAAPPRRVVTLQLGNGCSAAALADGRPLDTSMGFTPLEGLVMPTRPGDIDAGTVLYMLRQGRSIDSVEHDLNRRSGLLGLSGASADIRDLLNLEARGHAGAKLAVDAFCYRIRKYVGAYAAVLGGLDAVVFGGGIGEHSSVIRARIASGLEWLGLEVDAEANDVHGAGRGGRIGRADAAVDMRVVNVREELPIAEAVASLMHAAGKDFDAPKR